jgi:FMN-dependent NADH-azoreductase
LARFEGVHSWVVGKRKTTLDVLAIINNRCLTISRCQHFQTIMPTILHLDSSPLPTSISRELTKEYVNEWKTAHPGGTVIYRDLAASAPKPIDAAWVFASFTAEASRTPEQNALLATSEELIAELLRADEYVIGVAMHNFAIPSSLKLWIDQVVRAGRTFTYGADGPNGLVQGKRAVILSASGGVYSAGTPTAAANFMDPYLKTVLGFIGVTNATFVTAGGASRVMSGAVDRQTFLSPILAQVRALAA